jgi:hypothetical protein
VNIPRLATWLWPILFAKVADARDPDFVVGADGAGGPYLNRWFLSPWRRWQSRMRARAEAKPTRLNRLIARAGGLLPNLYLHQFLRDDDDRALHDHPSWAISFMLRGCYIEHTIAEGGIHQRRVVHAGSLRFLPTRHTHRIELLRTWWQADDFDEACDLHAADPTKSAPCWTLFLFGPTVRQWGFHCPERGWVHWQDFTAAGKPGEIGPGCDA